MMESPAKKLRQRRAILGAQQGDPESPAPGTLFSRRERLQAELRQVEAPVSVGEDEAEVELDEQAAVYGVVSSRSADAIQRDLRRVEREIGNVQESIEEVDRMIAEVEGKTSS